MDNTRPILLFVDSDQTTRDSITELFRDENWTCLSATDSDAARTLLQSHSIDILLVTDSNGENDCLQLVEESRNLYPNTVRIYITADKDSADTLKALAAGLVQQIVPKPWIDLELTEIIRSALRQSTLQKQHSPEFQALINSIPLLPSLPESYSNVRSCITGEDVNIEKMAEYISQDVAISTALLHWANSALFGQRFQVDTIKKAIIVLGTDIVENLILSESVNRTIAGKLPDIKGFDFTKFKKHSMATAVLSRLLIKSLLPTEFIEHDRAFIAGLLHDIGKLAAASFFPRQFEKAIEQAKKSSTPLPDAEMDVYHSHHAEIGGFLAEWWTLPAFVVHAIYWHHQPQSTPLDQDIIIATHVANLLSYQFGYGSNGDTCPRNISEEFCTKFYLNEETNEILRNETDQTIRMLVR